MKRQGIAAILVLALTIACAQVTWSLVSKRRAREVALSCLAPLPDLSRWPQVFRTNLSNAADQVHSPDHFAEGLRQLALLCTANGLTEQANRALEGLRKLEPRNALWPYLQADVKLRLADREGALALLQASRERDPAYVPGLRRLASTLADLGRLADASEVLSEALKREPSNIAVAYDAIVVDAKLGRDVRRRLEELARSNPSVRPFHEDLAQLLAAANDARAAAEQRALAASCELYPTTLDPRLDALDAYCYDTSRMLVRAIELRREARFEEFEALMKRVIDLLAYEPANPFAWDLLSNYYLKTGHPEDARKLLVKAVEQFPREPQMRILLIRLLCDLQRPNDAADAGREAVALWPARADIHEAYGVALRDKGKFGDAERELRASLEIDATRTEAQYELGTCLVLKGDRSGAHEAFSRALAMRPDYNDALFAIGKIDLEAGDFAEAEPYVERLLSARPDLPSARQLAGALHLEKAEAAVQSGNLESASSEIDAGLALAPDFAPLLKASGEVALARGLWKKAADFFTRYLNDEPDDPSGYVAQAEALAKAGLGADAQEALKSGLRAAERTGDEKSADQIRKLIGP